MVSVKKSVSLKPDGRDLEVADYWYCGFLESTVTIFNHTSVCFWYVNRNQMTVPLSFFCSSELYCLLAADANSDQMFPTPFVSFLFEKVH